MGLDQARGAEPVSANSVDPQSAAERYEAAFADRKRYVDDIVESPASRKIVVAGPGTGKTYLFKQVLRDKPRTLTLTFINSLIEQLALELYGMSEVRTLHGFARSELGRVTGSSVGIFPKLSRVIEEDATLLLGRNVKFEKMFCERDDANAELAFYQERKRYYGEWRGYSDVVFDLVKKYESDASCVPRYDQVVIDEFQDFNQLEVSLIDALADRNPILLAGDDDQALYDFKSASACHIRSKHGDGCPDYASFELPYCSRSTRVIVDAVNDVVRAATIRGLLRDRVAKSYKYFECESKDKESEFNPKIVYARVYSNQIPWAVEKTLKEVAGEVRSEFSVLVISQTRGQSDAIARALETKGFNNVRHALRVPDAAPSFAEGLRLIMEDKASNLGWRIAAGHVLEEKDLAALVRATSQRTQPVRELVPGDKRKWITRLVRASGKIEKGKPVETDEVEAVLGACSCSLEEILETRARETLLAADAQSHGDPGVRGIPITATTVQSSKGLAADYVFITHCDDQYMVKDKDKSNVADRDVCNFLVALTRARKRVYLISSQGGDPQFVQWIDAERIQRV